jgi:uncharacterized protein (TIGR03118 family)
MSTMHLKTLLTSACVIATLAGCGGGSSNDNKSGSSAPPPAATVSIAVNPTTIAQGQSAMLTWSASGTACNASGGWSGNQTISGTQTVTPTTSGTITYTLTCAGTTVSDPYGGTQTGAGGSASTTLTVNAASAFTKSNLVSDGSATAVKTDAKLINPWGLALSPTSAMWVANSGTDTSTLYDGTGNVLTLVVTVPPGTGGISRPTGMVFNSSTTDFAITANAKTGVPPFIFASEGGVISAWSPAVNGTVAIVAFDGSSASAKYTGLAIANNGTANFLYATDFKNSKVDVFDKTYTKVTTTGGFADATLPADYAPFGIQALQVNNQTQIFVAYAKRDAISDNETIGAGLGIVNVFDTNGTFTKRLVTTGGALNAPWGIALSPTTFGTLGNALLVGNFGDGVINAYDPSTGALMGAIKDANGTPIATPGLWGIAFGNGARNQPKNTLFFAAGTNGEANGLYGRIDLGATTPDIVAPTASITSPAAAAALTGTVQVTANAADNVGVTQVQFLAGTTSIGTSTTAPYAINWDTNTVANGTVSLTAQAKDAFGNVTTSAAVSVTVTNAVVKFSDLYTQIFASTGTGHCANCHTGGGATLPSSMNLSSATNAYAAFVGITSLETPTLQRVKAGDAANSWLINKLEGTNLGTTGRMPAGGPFLDQPTIDLVKTWINQGALNN